MLHADEEEKRQDDDDNDDNEGEEEEGYPKKKNRRKPKDACSLSFFLLPFVVSFLRLTWVRQRHPTVVLRGNFFNPERERLPPQPSNVFGREIFLSFVVVFQWRDQRACADLGSRDTSHLSVLCLTRWKIWGSFLGCSTKVQPQRIRFFSHWGPQAPILGNCKPKLSPERTWLI